MKTKKRLLALLLALLLLFSLLPVYAAADPDDTDIVEAGGTDDPEDEGCEHIPGEPVTENETEPGCTEPGSHDVVVYCSVCGEELSRETVTDPAPGHQSEDVDAVPAEVGKPGTAAGKKCSVCGEILEGCEAIEALPAEESGDEALITIKTQPKDAPIAEGEALFSVEAETEDAELRYQWQRLDDSAEYKDDEAREAAWEDLEGETDSTLRLTGPDALRAALPLCFRCVVSAGETSAATDEVRLAPEEKALDSTVVSGFAELKGTEYEWEYKPTLANLRSELPGELEVSLGGTGLYAEDAEGKPLLLAVRDAKTETLSVVWTSTQDYDEDLEIFDFVPVPEDEDCKLAEGLSAPIIKARVGEVYIGRLDGDLPGEARIAPIVGGGMRRRGLQKGGMSTSAYNGYEAGRLPPIRDQGSEGACWAFAGLGSMETDMITNGLADADGIGDGLSESHLAYYLTYDPPGNALRNGPLGDRRSFSGNYLSHGGNAYVASIILENGLGPVWEQPGDYSPYYVPSGNEGRAAQLTGAYYINPDDTAGIKAAILAHGGVYCSIYYDSSYYSATHNSYYCTRESTNHGIMLVGWDDSFSSEDFRQDNRPGSNGAWLVRNSWGGYPNAENDYGSAGYFWMSYEDTSWRNYSLLAFDVGQDVYQYCYAYDSLPFPTGSETLAANVPMSVRFTAAGNETVTAVGFETDSADLRGTVTVSCGEKSCDTAVSTSYAGYYLFTLSEPVDVSRGEVVTVTLRFNTSAEICYETSSGSVRFGQISLYPSLDSEGFFVGDSTVPNPNDARIKLYTKDSPAGEPTSVTKVTLSGDEDLKTVSEEDSTYALTLESGKSELLKTAVAPEGAADKTIVWSSDKPGIAKVDSGLILGISPGTAVITAAAHNGVKATCTVTVTGKSVVSVSLSKIEADESGHKVDVFNEESLSNVKDSDRDDFDLTTVEVTYTCEVLPEDALNKAVVWESSNPAVFDVDPDTGVGHYHSIGEATLTVTAKDRSNGIKSDSVLIKVDFTPCTITYDAGEGTGAPEPQQKCPYIPINLSKTVPTREGYRFLGWAKSAEADAPVVYQPGSFFTENTYFAENTSMTLYAVWAPEVRIEDLPEGLSTVSIDGVSYSVGENGSVPIPAGATFIEAYTIENPDSTDPHLRYPTELKVWRVTEDQNGAPVVERLEELDDVLQYSGFSIRISGTPGIRMITSVPTSLKAALISGSLADYGYTLVEYGTLIAWASNVGQNDMTLDSPNVRSAYAYKRGVSDPVFNVTNGLTQYTNVLVDFSYSQVPRDLAMRSYMKLASASDPEQVIVLYGGTVVRSIGYVAYQNRNAFAAGTDAYEFVWNLIHVTYGSRYDSEYRR